MRFRVIAIIVSLALVGGFIIVSVRGAKRGRAGRHLETPTHTLDIGVIEAKTTSTHTFDVKNVGNETVTIKEVRASCGCTNCDINRKVLSPGDIATITFTFNSDGFFRKIVKQITIESDDQDTPVQPIGFAGYVKVGIRPELTELNLGNGRFGEKLSGSMRLFRDLGQTCGPISLNRVGSSIKLGITDWNREEEIESAQLSFTLPSVTTAVGVHREELKLSVGSQAEWPLQIRYEVLPTVTYEPAMLRLVKDSESTRATLTWKGDPPLFKDSNTTFNKCLSKLQDMSQHQVTLSLMPRPGVAANKDDFDIVHVPYTLPNSQHDEVLDIPVIISGTRP